VASGTRRNHSTSLEIWKARTPIDHAERERFLLKVARIRSQIKETTDPESGEHLTASDKAAVQRRVVPPDSRRAWHFIHHLEVYCSTH